MRTATLPTDGNKQEQTVQSEANMLGFKVFEGNV